MSNFTPFLVRLYWGGETSYENGVVRFDPSTLQSSFIVYDSSMSYEDFLSMIYNHTQVDRATHRLKLLLYYTFQGVHATANLHGNEGMAMLCWLTMNVVNFVAEIKVSWETFNETNHPPGYMNLLLDFGNDNDIGSQGFDQDVAPTYNTNEGTGFQNSSSEEVDNSEDSEEPPSDNESGDEVPLPLSPARYSAGIYEGFPTGPMEPYDEVEELRDAAQPDFDDKDHMDVFNPRLIPTEIRVGMYFKDKRQVIGAIRKWSVECNREFFVKDSRPSCWTAICYTAKKNFESLPNTQPCRWVASASKTKILQMWKLKVWTSAHTCYSTVVQNNTRCLRSTDVAEHIMHLVKANVSIPVKYIQSHIKEKLHVDISYAKAWKARKTAIESLYGSWESNFEELPAYMKELQASNPGIVVQWLHHPHGSSECAIFKFVFWAFKPSIDAFRFCQPVISVDGTFLKGPYKSKLLIAVSKNANNYTLPVAYAIVDEETNESWCWFFTQLRDHVIGNDMGPICVISDRHQGLIHAMTNLPAWQEPHAYHRYCLRHVQSNFMAKFKNVSLKKLCWSIGCTSQAWKYTWYRDQLKFANREAWNYLKNIDLSKWTIFYDEHNRRWGNLTTNISESWNGTLREARFLPIKALINYIFCKDVDHYAKHTEICNNCNTALPPRI